MDHPSKPEPRREMMAARAKQATLSGIALNAALAVCKGLAGYFGHSYALIADAIESLVDVLSSMVVYVGLSVASLPPSEKHPYGRGRAETLAALFVALTLFVAAIGIAIQSVHEIRTPHQAPAPFTLLVLVAVVIIKEKVFRRLSHAGLETGSAAVTTDAWHQRADAITSLAAFLGISGALILGQGYEALDDWAALFASAVIAFNAWMLLAPALANLLDARPNRLLEERIRSAAAEVTGVLGTHKCFVRKVGFDHFVDLDILVDGSLSVKEGHDIAHRVQEFLKQEYPAVTRVLVHVEPMDEHGRFPLFQ